MSLRKLLRLIRGTMEKGKIASHLKSTWAASLQHEECYWLLIARETHQAGVLRHFRVSMAFISPWVFSSILIHSVPRGKSSSWITNIPDNVVR